VLPAACKAAEDSRNGARIPGGSHHVQLVDYTNARTVLPGVTKGAHRRLRLRSRIVGGGCLDDAERSKSSPAGECCCQANCLDHRSLVSGSEPYRRVRRTTGSTVTCKGRGSSAWLSCSQALLKGDSAQHSRRSHSSDTVDCAVDCSVGVGTYRPDAKGVQSVQRDRHRARDAIAAAPSID
jgi:hypothetical protein